MIAAAFNGVRLVAALLCSFLAAFFAAIPLLAPGSQRTPSPVLVVSAIAAAGMVYVLWPWRRRYLADRVQITTTPVSVEGHEADGGEQYHQPEMPMSEGTPRANHLDIRPEERRLARRAAQADGHKWHSLTREQRREYLRRARNESAG